MRAWLGAIRRFVLGIAPEETSFARRGFREGEPGHRERLELIGRVFLEGYHAALERENLASLASQLDTLPEEYRGFAYEGAAMALRLLDYLTPWQRDRVQRFNAGPGAAHTYMVHVGVGWAMARMRGSVDRALARLDPLLGWLALDGYGFHEGYFKGQDYLQGKAPPQRIQGYAGRVFDQGLGRSLWFIHGADVKLVATALTSFPARRQKDLWSGVGLASAYTGIADERALRYLRQSAGDFQPQLAQGAAFAAKARLRAGNLTPQTELAVTLLCDRTAKDAAQLTDAALENLPGSGAEPNYEVWRCRVQTRLTAKKEIKG